MNNHWIKPLLISLLFLSSSAILKSQTGVGTWKTYFAYQQASSVVETGSLIFAIYDGSLLSYDPEYQEVVTYAFADGLSDTGISLIKYAPEQKALILVYENSNIDIFYGRNNVVNFSDIKDKTLSKNINSIEIIDNYIYFCTGFGISVFDLNKSEFKEDYNLRENTWSVCKKGNYLYAATASGIKKGLTSLNLQDRENWQDATELNYQHSPNNLRRLLIFKDKLVAQGLYNIDYEGESGQFQSLLTGNFNQTTVLHDELVVVDKNHIHFYKDFFSKNTINIAAKAIDSRSSNEYWLARGENGLCKIERKLNTNEYKITLSDIKINSPKKNWNYSMKFINGKLYVLGGGRGIGRLNREGVLMIYEDGEWFNLNTSTIQSKTGVPCLDFISIAVDPHDPEHYFISSWGEGVYEFQNNEFVKLYSIDNSSLQTAIPSDPYRYVRVDGLVYDKNNNLYMLNSVVNKGLSILSAEGKWISRSYTGLTLADVGQILIANDNVKWISVWRKNETASPGILVLDDKGTIDNPSDDEYSFSSYFVDGQGRNVGALFYYCMAQDLSGTVWVGTDNGPILFSRASDVSNSTCRRLTAADSDGIGYYLLEGTKVTCITVDGANRKWLGTEGNGVYMIDNTSSDIHVENFTTTNSLLISNNINSIAINDDTGEVFVGTDKGLVSYQSDAIQGLPDYSDVYAFPNPVYPDKQSSSVAITGLMSNSVVKITDMSGNLIMQGTSIGGMYTWNCTDTKGTLVKPGIYLVFAGQEDGSLGVATKIMVIR